MERLLTHSGMSSVHVVWACIVSHLRLPADAAAQLMSQVKVYSMGFLKDCLSTSLKGILHFS